MTFENVMKAFADYLREDKDCEVLQTRHGYTVMMWDDIEQRWNSCEYCATPEQLADELMNGYTVLLEYQATKGQRELDDNDHAQIEKKQKELLERLKKPINRPKHIHRR